MSTPSVIVFAKMYTNLMSKFKKRLELTKGSPQTFIFSAKIYVVEKERPLKLKFQIVFSIFF